MFASSIVTKTEKAQKPDLDSHSLIRFLDKFVYRNAKTSDASKGASIMQPLRATKDLGDTWLGTKAPGAATSVNSAAFWKKKAEDVAAEDVFFHEYFQQIAKDGKVAKKVPAADEAEDEDAAEDEIWKALVSAQPDIGEDDSDMGFDDLDEEDMASDADSPAMLLDDSDMDDLEDSDDMGVDIEGSDDELIDGANLVDEDEEVKEKESKPKSRRRMLKDLPMFASVDDYAALMGDDDEDM